MLQKNPEARVSAQQALKHPYFDEVYNLSSKENINNNQ